MGGSWTERFWPSNNGIIAARYGTCGYTRLPPHSVLRYLTNA